MKGIVMIIRLLRRARTLAFSAALALGTLHAHYAKGSPDQDQFKFEGEIEFSTDGQVAESANPPNEVHGIYNYAGSLVYFETRGLTEGKPAVDGATPDKVLVRLEVNDTVLDHEIDFVANKATIDGYGVTLFPEHIRALRAFYPMLEKGLYERYDLGSQGETQRPDARLPLAMDALNHAAMMYAEAPVGYIVAKRVFNIPSLDGKGFADEDPNLLARRESLLTGEQPGAAQEGCYQIGEDGVLRIGGNICDRVVATQEHDAQNHCYVGFGVEAGCHEPNCRGRCSIGCGIFNRDGSGLYTYDCLDHDFCLDHHGGPSMETNPDCGDEFSEAQDDFFTFSGYNCPGACR